MKSAILSLFVLFSITLCNASGYYPWGWQGWLQSVATITDAPSSGVLTGSVVFAQDNDELYYWDGSEWTELSGGGGGSGTVTSVSVVSANGFAGTVADATTTPAITMETSITGLLHGNGTAVAAETVSSPLNESSGTLSCLTASGSQAGCLSSTDWTTFNGKQSTLTFSDSLVNSSGTVTLSGDTASPSDSQYYGTDSGGTLGYFDLPGSGVTTVGTFGSQSSAANGAVISGSDIYFQDFTSANPGMAPASGGGTTNFLRADGSWAAPSGSSGITQLTGDVTAGPGSGSQAASLVATSNSTLTSLSALTSASSLSTVGTIGTGTWNGTEIGVGYGGTGLTSGTSGGIPYFSSDTTMASSGTLADGELIIGGGATAAPSSFSSGSAGQVLSLDGSDDLTWLSPPTSPTASSFAGWDANENLSANAMVQAYATTATAAGTTTLTVASAPIQYFTGTTTQTVVLPVVSTLPQTGFTYWITNLSTGIITVESSGANVIGSIDAGQTASFSAILLTGTTAASWNEVTNSSSANVTSSGSGQYHTEYALVSSACTTSPCTLTSSSAGISGITRNAQGSYTVNFPDGQWSAAPACVVVGSNNMNGNYTSIFPYNYTTSSFSFYLTDTANSGANTDGYFSIICMGPH